MDYMLKFKELNFDIRMCGFDSGSTLLYDKQRFQQVFLNFLSNAVKFAKTNDRIRVVLFKVSQKEAPSLKKELIDFYGPDFLKGNDSDDD